MVLKDDLNNKKSGNAPVEDGRLSTLLAYNAEEER